MEICVWKGSFTVWKLSDNTTIDSDVRSPGTLDVFHTYWGWRIEWSLFRFVIGKPFYRYAILSLYSFYILRYSCRYANPFQYKLFYTCSYDIKAKYTWKRWVLPTNDWKKSYNHFFAAFARGLSVRNVPIHFHDDVDHIQGYLICGLEPGLSTPWSPDLEKTRFELSFAIFSMVFHWIR